MTKELLIKGMTCGHCEMQVKEALKDLEGVSVISVETGKAEIEAAETIEFSTLASAIEEAGYELISVN